MRHLLIAVAFLPAPSLAAPAALDVARALAPAGFEAAGVASAAGSADLGGFSETATLGPVRVRSYSAANAAPAAAAAAAAGEVDLAALLNKHLKTALTRVLAGKQVWLSGCFDRQQKAFVSLLEDGKAARFYDVEKLLTPVKDIEIGTGKFRLKIAPDLGNQMDSEIILTNQADRSNWVVTLKEMLEAVSAAGELLTLHGQEYRLFYYDDIKDGVVQPTRSLAFIMTDAQGEIHVFLIPEELLPGTFKMYGNKPVVLQKTGGKLRITER